MLNIEWVEIPAGESIIGLSDEERRRLLGKLDQQLWGIRRLVMGARERAAMARLVLMSAPARRQVFVSSFYISRFPITVEQYADFQKHKAIPPLAYDQYALSQGWGRLPKILNYSEAMEFCHYLDVRLPTSVEWEKAARGPQGYLYPWGNKWDPRRANVDQKFANRRSKARESSGSWYSRVDAFPTGQSAYGVWDMVGNVQEWTSTYKTPANSAIQGHVVRRWPIRHCDDLAWVYNLLAVEHSNVDGQTHPEWGIGFRVARD